MSVLEPDYDADPGRWGAWEAPRDVHHLVARELHGPVLDVGCGEGRLAAVLADRGDGAERSGTEGGDGGRGREGVRIEWVGVDTSRTQLAANPHRPVVRADMRALPFADATFAEVTHLWCLYHLDDPVAAVAEAARVLRPGGHYFACTSARDNDPELMPEGYPPTTFDAEDALDVVSSVFPGAVAETWDQPFFPLRTREDVRGYCRHNYVPPERAESAELPLWLTKRGVLIRASKPAD